MYGDCKMWQMWEYYSGAPHYTLIIKGVIA